MKIIAGLGNPGREYAQTKHNVGFMLVDALAGHLGVTTWREKSEALVAETRIGAEKVLLVKPQTYMNESGRALGPLMSFYKLAPEDLIVCHDDMDIPCGTIRIRKKGSAGGHNGIKSILAHVEDTTAFHALSNQDPTFLQQAKRDITITGADGQPTSAMARARGYSIYSACSGVGTNSHQRLP